MFTISVVPTQLCLCGTIAARSISTLTPLSSDAARPSARYDTEVCRECAWFRQARKPYKQQAPDWSDLPSFEHHGFTSFCPSYDGAVCSDLPRHHCLLPPHGVEDCSVFSSSFLCAWLHSGPSPRSFPSSWPGTAPFRSCLFDATGKPLTRWRLALAKEAARGTFLRPLSHCVLFRFFIFADCYRTALN